LRIAAAAAVALLALTACDLSLTHKADFRALVFQATADPQIYQAGALGRVIQLMGPNDVFHPQEWRGPLRIVGACSASVSQVAAVYASRDVGYLLVVDRNGAIRSAHFIDLYSCHEVWPALKAEIPIQVTGDAIQIERNQWLRLFNDRPPLTEPR
jgi:hypothetical protein